MVFTGHPSLRFGDVVHFIEMWGSSNANTIIFTGIHFPFLTKGKGGRSPIFDKFVLILFKFFSILMFYTNVAHRELILI